MIKIIVSIIDTIISRVATTTSRIEKSFESWLERVNAKIDPTGEQSEAMGRIVRGEKLHIDEENEQVFAEIDAAAKGRRELERLGLLTIGEDNDLESENNRYLLRHLKQGQSMAIGGVTFTRVSP